MHQVQMKLHHKWCLKNNASGSILNTIRAEIPNEILMSETENDM